MLGVKSQSSSSVPDVAYLVSPELCTLSLSLFTGREKGRGPATLLVCAHKGAVP